MYDKVEKKVSDGLRQDIENKNHHIKVLLWFTVFLFAVIVFVCSWIYVHDKPRKISKPLKSVDKHSRLQGWTSKELAQVTNMRPLYVVQEKR